MTVSAEAPISGSSMRSFCAMLERLVATSNTINITLVVKQLTILTRLSISLRLLVDADCDHRKLLQFILDGVQFSVDMLVIVNDSPLRSHSSLTALRFCRAATRKGHVVRQVFFYLDGVYQQLAVSARETGEPDLLDQWQEFAEKAATELVVCAAASHRRVPPGQKSSPAFRQGSLIEMLDLTTRVDRLISFGGP